MRYIKWVYTNKASNGGNIGLGTLSLSARTITTPELIVSTTELTGLDYTHSEGPSEAQSFDVTGTDTNGTDVTVTAPANFEVSKDNTTFANNLTLEAYDGASTPIYVRLSAGLETGTYNGEVSLTGAGTAAATTVSVSGDVTAALNPTLATSTTELTGLDYTHSEGPSEAQSFDVTGTDTNGTDVTVTAPANFEVSKDNTTFANNVTLEAYDGASTPIYVRLSAGLETGTYNGEVSLTGAGTAAATTVSVSGDVTAALNPTLATSTTELTGLDYTHSEGPSETQSFDVSGTDTNGTDVTVTAPANFEVSKDNTTFANNVTLEAYDGASTPIYVRLAAGLNSETYTGAVTLSGAGTEEAIEVTVTGEVKTAASVGKTDINGLAVYPNPAQNIVHITSDEVALKQVRIIDTLGKKVMETSTLSTLTVDHLKAGVYFMHITQNGKTATTKLIIK